MNVRNIGLDPARWREDEERNEEETRSFEPSPGVDAHAQHLVLSFAANQDKPKPDNDDVAFIAFTPGAEREAAALAKTAHGHVAIVHGTGSGAIDAFGRSFDLSNRDEIDRFTTALDVPLPVRLQVASVIWSAPFEARHELAALAMLWAPAERGESSPSRMVVSGHGYAGGVRNETASAELTFDAIGELAKAMPNAAARVEDVMIDACFQGQAHRLAKLVAAFPNLKTAHGYEHSAPEGDVDGVRRWEAATRGRAEVRVALYPEGSSWTTTRGYSTRTITLETARAEERRLDVFDDYFDGKSKVEDASKGPLYTYYNALQRLVDFPGLPGSERETLSARLAQALNLRHYAKVAENFVRDHAAAIGAGCAALGVRAPDFARLGRKEALAAIADVERRAASRAGPEVRELVRLLGLFRALPNCKEVRWS